MADVLPVLRVLGMLVMLFALAMGVPLAVSLHQQDGVWQVYPIAMAAALGSGAALTFGLRRYRRELLPRHGVMLVSLAWWHRFRSRWRAAWWAAPCRSRTPISRRCLA